MNVTFTIPDFDYKFRLKMSVKFFPNILIDFISWYSGEFHHADRTEAELRIGQYADQPSLNYTSAIYIPSAIFNWLY